MLALIFAPILSLLVAATTSGVPSAYREPVAITGATVAIADRAKDLIGQIQDGKIDRALLTPSFSEVFTEGVLASDATFLAGRGKPTHFGLIERNDVSDDVRYVFLAGWNDGAIDYTLGIDKATGLIDALYFRPAGNQN